MRCTITLVTLVVLAGSAHADARIDQLVKGYEHEQTACRKQENGVAKILDGATMLLERKYEDALAADVKTLHAAHEDVASYCTALAATIEFLRADPSASYKSLEKQISDRDSHVRVLRVASKKALAVTEPLIERWIPKINAARIENDKSAVPKPAIAQPAPDATAAKPEPKPEARPEPRPAAKPEPKPEARPEPRPAAKPVPQPTPTPEPRTEPKPDAAPVSAKFPSGRRVKLPQLGGTWEVRGDAVTDVADYVESGTHTSVVVEVFPGVSCSSQLARLQAKAYGRQATKQQARPRQAWRVLLPGSDAPTIVACAATRTGSALVTLDAPDASHPDLSELAWAMLASLAK